MAQDRGKWKALVNAEMNLRPIQNAGKLTSGYIAGSLSSSSQFHIISLLVSILLVPVTNLAPLTIQFAFILNFVHINF
jgi:hypothetical protein